MDKNYNSYISDIYKSLGILVACEESELLEHAKALIAEDAIFYVSHPFNTIRGRDAIVNEFIKPLRAAITPLRRRDLIFIGGPNQRDYGGDWCASVVHYVGNFTAPLSTVQPSKSLVFLRAGEFYRHKDGVITEARIILDLVDLMQRTGQSPFPAGFESYGAEITFPAPATQDGILPKGKGDKSFACVEKMLKELHVFDPETMSSPAQTGDDGCWHDDMMWYGPAGIGSNFTWPGFVKDHREPFLQAFPDRKGGNHYARLAQGNYAAVSGWPSMTMTWQGDYLGHKADGRAMTLRVMDFYRCEETEHGHKIMENWVLLDYGDLLKQMGHDPFGGDSAA